ncbi:MAG: DUF4157 domain-containing protein [Nitrosomonas sp.]|nr:DUF4157 domain-containing protein [Nitrosomonas sp.]
MFALTYRTSCTGSPVSRPRPKDKILHAPQAASVKQILGANRAQAALKIGPQNDRFEQEADRIANQVVSGGHGAGAVRHIEGVSGAQRMCEDCGEELQRKPINNVSSGGASGEVSNASPKMGSGQKLSVSQRSFFESRMGYGFENVRIHTDEQAARSAEAINSRAYTLGRDIVFNAGEYQPGTRDSDRLLAHELVHVIQQRAAITALPENRAQLKQLSTDGMIQRFSSSSSSDSSGSSDENDEDNTAPSTGTGSACKVDVRATHIGGVLSGLPIWHLFIVYTDSAGTEFYYRGGPGGSCPGVDAGEYGTIIGTHGRYVAGTVDWDTSAPSVTVLSGASACGKDSCFASELSRIDGTCTPYAPTGPNSNTVVSTLLSNCSVPRSKPVAIAPGWGDPNL